MREMTNQLLLEGLHTELLLTKTIIKEDFKGIDMAVSIKSKNNSILQDNWVDLKKKELN